jgi:molybdopterin-guanine dinucleotide biosynthesis protein A
MGRDKAGVRLDGRTLLERAITCVREAGGEPLIIGPPRPASDMLGARQSDESEGAPDADPGQGPLPALRHGLAICPGPFAVVLACDLPLVPAALLRLLAGEIDRFDAVVPRARGELQVLAAAYGRACLEAIDLQLASGARAVHGFLDRVRLRVLEPESLRPFGGEEIFLNVNRPEDLALALERLQGKEEG